MNILSAASILFYLLGSINLGLATFKQDDSAISSKSLTLILIFIAVLFHVFLLYQIFFTSAGPNLSFYNGASFIACVIVLLILIISLNYSVISNKSLTLILGFAAVLFHVFLLHNTLFASAGLNLGFYNAASLICCVITLFVLITSLKKPVLNLALFVMPMAALTIALDMLFPNEQIIDDSSTGLKMHILLSIVAYSLLTMAALQACLLAFQERFLRNKKPGRIMKFLPPLQIMENLLVQMIALGFFVLSMSLLTGFMFLHDIFAQHLVHKTVLSILAWFLFAILLWGRWSKGWRGQTIIRWTLGGFVSLMLAYFGSKFVLELIL